MTVQLMAQQEADRIFRELLTDEEIAEIDEAAAREVAALKSLQEDVSKIAAQLIAESGLGIGDFANVCDLDRKSVSRLVTGAPMVNLFTLARVAASNKKKIKIIFDDRN